MRSKYNAEMKSNNSGNAVFFFVLEISFALIPFSPFSLPLQAYVVLGQFLVLKKDEELFRDWLKETCGANSKQQGDCYGCLREWCDSFL